MFTTRPNGAAPAHLALTRAACRAYDGDSGFAGEPSLSAYLADMGHPYGATLDRAAVGTGHSHAEMAEPLIEALDLGTAPIDVLVLAQRMHDVSPGRATATYLASRCPGTPLALSVCDQGTAAPFTGLRLLAAYAASGACRRALLIVTEQATLHYDLVAPAALPDQHTAVALLLETGPPEAIRVRQSSTSDTAQAGKAQAHAGVPSQGEPLRSTVLDLGAGRQSIAGGLWTTADVVLRDPGRRPLTGLWWELAAGLDKWAADGTTVALADHDPTVGLTSIAEFDLTQGD